MDVYRTDEMDANLISRKTMDDRFHHVSKTLWKMEKEETGEGHRCMINVHTFYVSTQLYTLPVLVVE
jgi:uncharacterized protein YijF (DUF1287 family)